MRLKVVIANVLSGEKHPIFGGGSPFSMSDFQDFPAGKGYFYLLFDYGANARVWPPMDDMMGSDYYVYPTPKTTHEGHPSYIIDIKTPNFPAGFVAAFEASKEIFVSIGVPIFTMLSEPTIQNYTVGSDTVSNFWIFDDETGALLASYADGVDASPAYSSPPRSRDPLLGTYYPVNPWRKITLGSGEPDIFWTNKVLCVEE